MAPKQRKVWDKKKKRLITVGGQKKEGRIKSESGAWIPASYKSGRYAGWLEKTKTLAQEDDDDEEVAAPSNSNDFSLLVFPLSLPEIVLFICVLI